MQIVGKRSLRAANANSKTSIDNKKKRATRFTFYV